MNDKQTRRLWHVTPADSTNDHMAVLQVVDHIATRRVRIGLHAGGKPVGWVELDEPTLEHFKACCDDAMNVALGRTPPRAPDDPNAFHGFQ